MSNLGGMDLALCKERLSAAGITFEPGLGPNEIATIESRYGFRFPPDLRDFLRGMLPVSKGWPNWRREGPSEILKRLSWPIDGICFDIEHSSFWPESWGQKPQALADAFAIARAAVAAAPRLIPVCGHRFLPERPPEAGNPVFSVYQTDIICYGKDLFDYFCNEFGYWFGRSEYRLDGGARHIDFWSDLAG